VLAWELMKSDGRRRLIRCQRIMNFVEYQSVLDKVLLGSYNYDKIFVQDGTPCHQSAFTYKYLDTKNMCDE